MSRVPGAARRRSAISRWTITVQAAIVGSWETVRRISGVAIEYGRFETIAVGGGASVASSIRIASPQITSTFAFAETTASSSLRRRVSSSTTMTRSTSGAMRSVSAPSPPPTSSTTSPAPTPDSRVIASSRLGSARKF